jgi:hypothetical protein
VLEYNNPWLTKPWKSSGGILVPKRFKSAASSRQTIKATDEASSKLCVKHLMMFLFIFYVVWTAGLISGTGINFFSEWIWFIELHVEPAGV